jgi:alkanesulfonate monooxygenase SsuD/methylene tetrahydromethanopterin reductase-like flavin-dependent oxidoreductase (luciferase family)
MRIGVAYPHTELGGDAGAVRAYGQRVEELGYPHLLAYDHVVGADPAVYPDWNGPYDISTTFHEPLAMFGYLAVVTTSLELVTGVIILPQRAGGPRGQASHGGGPAHQVATALR